MPLWEGIRDNNVPGCTLLLAAVPLLHLGSGCSGWRPSLREDMARGFPLKTDQLAFPGSVGQLKHFCCVAGEHRFDAACPGGLHPPCLRLPTLSKKSQGKAVGFTTMTVFHLSLCFLPQQENRNDIYDNKMYV